MNATPRRCRRERYCKLDAAHQGSCSPYTLRPLTREQWAALDPANRYRVRIDLDNGECYHLIYRADRTEAEAELAEQLPEFRAFCQRHPYMAQITGGDIEDRGEGVDLPELILQRLGELSENSEEE